MKPEAVVVHLNKMSEEKHVLMQRILKLTEKQRKVLEEIDEASLKLLNQIIEEKQQLANQVDELDKSFLESFQALKVQLGISQLDTVEEEPVPGFKALQVSISQIMEVIKQIQTIDELNTESAHNRVAAIKQELQTIRFGKQVNKGYGKKYIENASILFDKKR